MQEPLKPISVIKTGIYQHFRTENYYHVLEVARHSETLEEYVVYKALYGDFGIWIRPLVMFFESVVCEGKTVPRFTFISDDVLGFQEKKMKC